MKKNLLNLITLLVFTIFFVNSCGLYKRSDIKDNPVNVDERVQRNIQEGRGVRFGVGATRGGNFDFGRNFWKFTQITFLIWRNKKELKITFILNL